MNDFAKFTDLRYVLLVGGDGMEGFYKGLVRQLFAGSQVACRTIRDGAYQRLIATDDFGKRLTVTSAGLLDEYLVRCVHWSSPL